MKMNKKGFTLIELLAVIVILAIIALIATPIVLNVVDNAKKSAANSEARMIVSGIEKYCTMALFGDASLTGANSADCTATTGENPKTAGEVVKSNIAKMVDLGDAKLQSITMEGSQVKEIVVESNDYYVQFKNDAWVDPTKTNPAGGTTE